MVRYSTIFIFILLGKSYGQEIVFSSELEHKPNNIFNNVAKVSESDNYLTIDYPKNSNCHSFIIDQNFNSLEILFKKNTNEAYRNFLESYGTEKKHWFVFKGFDDDKLLFSNIGNDAEKLIELDKNKHIGAFVSSDNFYQFGYNKKRKKFILNIIDIHLNKTTKEFNLFDLLKNLDEKTQVSIEKIFLNMNFDEISYQQVNTIKEISRTNKFYVLEDKLILTLNPKKDNSQQYISFSLVEIDLNSFESNSKNYKVSLPSSDERFKNVRVSCSYLHSEKLFIVVGGKNGFALSIFDTNTNDNLLTDIVANGFEKDKKKFQKKINSVFKLKRVGLKVNKSNDAYYLTLGGYEEGTNRTPGGQVVYSYETEKSVRFILDKKVSINNEITEYHPFEKIEAFRKDSFYNKHKIFGNSFDTPKKRHKPEGEVQFKFHNKYYYAYYDKKTNQYTIRKFN